MATLTVWKCDTADGADTAVATLQHLQSQSRTIVHDAAMVLWTEGKKKPRTRQLTDLAGAEGPTT